MKIVLWLKLTLFCEEGKNPSLFFAEFFDLVENKFKEMRIFSVFYDELILVEKILSRSHLENNGDDNHVIITTGDYELSLKTFIIL